MFIIGFVGTELFGQISLGWKLLAAIHIANILFFLIALLFLSRDTHTASDLLQPTPKQIKAPLLEALKESSNVIILVATTVIFFRLSEWFYRLSSHPPSQSIWELPKPLPCPF